jgi:hypothetical protein
MSKRLLFGDNSADDGARQRLADETRHFLERFKFTIPTRRRNRLGVGPHWDSAWGSSLRSAADELNIEAVQINSQFCVQTQTDATAIRARAEAIHQARLERYSDRVKTLKLPGASK